MLGEAFLSERMRAELEPYIEGMRNASTPVDLYMSTMELLFVVIGTPLEYYKRGIEWHLTRTGRKAPTIAQIRDAMTASVELMVTLVSYIGDALGYDMMQALRGDLALPPRKKEAGHDDQ